MIERICVATDGSDGAVRAAQMAVLPARAGARIAQAGGVACETWVAADPREAAPPEYRDEPPGDADLDD